MRDFFGELNASALFKSQYTAVVRRSLALEFPAATIAGDVELDQPDWPYLLRLASGLALVEVERAQEAALRIAQACLEISANADLSQVAVVLLERLGNQPAITLAQNRQLIGDKNYSSDPLDMDTIRRRLELGIPLAGSPTIAGNEFQRRFWTAVSESRRVSISAPTSAGKSFIVRSWFNEVVSASDTVRAIYVVPTRALIDEVVRDLQDALPADVGLYCFPWDPEIGSRPKQVHVLTQERLQILLSMNDATVDLLFVDEAQKVADRSRGVILQFVVEEVQRRFPECQVVYASPMISNPQDVVVEGGSLPRSFVTETVTVIQNLLWANQVKGKPKRWELQAVSRDNTINLGQFDLSARPSPDGKRLPYVAVALGGSAQSNLVYVNGQADAERVALQIAEALGEKEPVDPSAELAALAQLARDVVHPEYGLVGVVGRKVAFHYGNMPLILRCEIERLFREGHLRFLVCTSTLVEGVNLPCRNIFLRGPKRGKGNPMSEADFWNLAGRAGRWGKEFQGNIVCVDTNNKSQWPAPPRQRERYAVVKAMRGQLVDPAKLLAYIRGNTSLTGRELADLEYAFSYLSSHLLAGRDLEGLAVCSDLPDDVRLELTNAIRLALEDFRLPASLVGRNLGISPISMQRLLNFFESTPVKSTLLVVPPESADAIDSYTMVLGTISRFLTPEFGSEGRRLMLAMLLVNWMRGWPLRRIIESRISYKNSKNQAFSLPALLRECMGDVEQFGRFLGPKYLTCYIDVLQFHMVEIGREADLIDVPNVGMLLELGVSRSTELALLAIGLSRTAAVALSQFIVADDLDRAGCLAWLRSRDLGPLSLPPGVEAEIRLLLTRYER